MADPGFRILSKQVQALNRHLAKSRGDLKSLLEAEEPKIELRDGSEHDFKKEELKKLAELLPRHLHKKMRLPIYIELSSDKYGSGTGRITGELECRVAREVLEKEGEGDELFIYMPEIKLLRRKLPTTTDYMFTIAIDG
jgi:uncharacterized protein (UPF0216 family)